MLLETILQYRFHIRRNLSNYVPKHLPVTDSDVQKLQNFFLTHRSGIVVLTGAGISTESGLPDYRSEDVGLYARSNHKPMTYQEFMKEATARKRYWARSFVAWPRFSSVFPNSTHEVLARLETRGITACVITQNVDNLHQKAGCRDVVELHGSLYRVICAECGDYGIDRHTFQATLRHLNPAMTKITDVLRPDGDVELTSDEADSFVIPCCPKCNGCMKPDVIFFGENVPSERVQRVKLAIDNCSSVLVLGSSLSVYSAYRIILQAVGLGKPVCIVNIGPTRADDLATLKLSTKCGEILPAACINLLS